MCTAVRTKFTEHELINPPVLLMQRQSAAKLETVRSWIIWEREFEEKHVTDHWELFEDVLLDAQKFQSDKKEGHVG